MTDRAITKAVIPIAGLGKRMGPLCRAVPKAMLPLVGADGRLRPIVDHILQGVAAAGIATAALIVAPRHRQTLETYFAADADDPARPDVRVEMIVQPSPAGLGDAALLAESFAAGRPFLLLLGDHLHVPADSSPPCAGQVARAWSARPDAAAMVGMQVVAPDDLHLVGAARGEPAEGHVYRCREIIEKPDLATARRRLITPGLPPDRFLAHGGIYAFSAEIFDCLRELSARPRPAESELQLTDAQAILLKRRPQECYLLRLAGQCLDTGTPAGWLAAQQALLERRGR